MKGTDKKLGSTLKMYVKTCFFGIIAVISMFFIYFLTKITFFNTNILLYESNLFIAFVELLICIGLLGLSIIYFVDAVKTMYREEVKK